MQNNSNFFLAIMLSLAVMIGWQVLVIDPKMQAQRAAHQATNEATNEAAPAPARPSTPPAPQAQSVRPAPEPAAAPPAPRLPTPRLAIRTPQLSGSLALRGARLDDLILTQYAQEQAAGAPLVRLLNDGAQSWHITHGWVTGAGAVVKTPDDSALWRVVDGATLTPQTPVTLQYDNGAGLMFTRHISVDDRFMFTIRQSVSNRSGQAVTLYPFGQITRNGTPAAPDIFILHQGGIGVLGEEGLVELDYDEMREARERKIASQGGWLGLSDKYWATVLIPPQQSKVTARFVGTGEQYRTDFLLPGQTIAAGGSIEIESRVFAGAKVVDIVDSYADSGIAQFDLVIDWGWFYFLTKPMFFALQFFYALVGNYGVSILLVTVLIKLLFFPLANRSYETMAKMKKLQPKMMALRENYKDDKMRQQQELLKIYREENLRPLSGCLPVLLQIPVFFALYKVLFVTLDMRHQPFFGWVQDLSAPDPTSLFNLFGLLPFEPPGFLLIGVWPLLMGITMFVQMQMNPPPPDPIQARIFMFLPLIFTFILASFPAGLVVYWTWNNLLSVLQQGLIMRRNGVAIALLDNLGFAKKPPHTRQ